MTKAEILLKIDTLLEQRAEKIFRLSLRSKKRSELLNVLEEIKHLFSLDNEFDSCIFEVFMNLTAEIA